MDRSALVSNMAEYPISSVYQATRLRKVLNVMFPHSYIELYHQPPRSVCSIFKMKTIAWQQEDDSSAILKYEASSEPLNRTQIVSFQQQLQRSLVEHGAKLVGLCSIRRAIYDQCFGRLKSKKRIVQYIEIILSR